MIQVLKILTFSREERENRHLRRQNFKSVSRKFYIGETHFKEKAGQLCLIGKFKADDIMMNRAEKN